VKKSGFSIGLLQSAPKFRKTYAQGNQSLIFEVSIMDEIVHESLGGTAVYEKEIASGLDAKREESARRDLLFQDAYGIVIHRSGDVLGGN
jgi:hypothetical protein